jgi:hypothetical protein
MTWLHTKAQLLANPHLVLAVQKQLHPELAAMQTAAAARQAAVLAKQRGKETAAIAERLQAMQLDTSVGIDQDRTDVSMSATAGAGDATVPLDSSAGCEGNATPAGSSSSSSATSSSADVHGVPPVTPGDITVAANALLVACKAAGALWGVPQLLERSLGAHGDQTAVQSNPDQLDPQASSRRLAADLQDLAEWVVLLHPLLVQLLPAEQGQVLVGLSERLGGGGGSSSGSSSNNNSSVVQEQEATRSSYGLSTQEVAWVLGALQHVVIPGQRGCCNPRCCCLEGVSEAEMKTQVCVACRGARYCSAACQKAHWRAGHKEVCKAVQAAAKAAGEGTAVGGAALTESS